MIIAVFDTNALASCLAGIRRPPSTPGEVLRRWLAGAFDLVVSEPILVELRRTVDKPYFRRQFADPEVAAAYSAVQRGARVVPILVDIRRLASHPKDDLALATALSAGADYLVTGDRQLQLLGTIDGIAIVSPREFLDVLASVPPED